LEKGEDKDKNGEKGNNNQCRCNEIAGVFFQIKKGALPLFREIERIQGEGVDGLTRAVSK